MIRSSRQVLSLLAVVALALLGANSCDSKESKRTAENAVEKFHVLFNEGGYNEIYDRADQTYRDAISETDTIALFAMLRQKLGNVRQSKQVGWSIDSSTLGTTVRLEYKTEFANGKATEQFTFLESSGDPRLMNYDIQSPLLIKNR
ncbi:MAG: hypothetical protein QOF62_1063 [Pyrinomonadaceae bacterium]|jgi:hypothetical protein|nr:hypothetical protein [Pyrinomonadaceae bacterium]